MRSFSDNTGKKWTLEFTLGSLLRVKHGCGVDMLNVFPVPPGEQPLPARLLVETETLANVLVAMVRPYLRGESLSDEAFLERLGGEHIDAARLMLLEDWADFFHEQKRFDQEKVVRTALATIAEVQSLRNGKADGIDPAAVARSISGKTSGSAPASSDSTPAPSPSASSTP